MASRRRTIAKLPLTKGEGHVIDIDISYCEGGIDYGTYRQKPRGYYLSVSPIEEGYSASGTKFTAFGLFSGLTQLIEPANRFSQKKLDTLVAPQDVIDTLVAKVLDKNGLELVEEK